METSRLATLSKGSLIKLVLDLEYKLKIAAQRVYLAEIELEKLRRYLGEQADFNYQNTQQKRLDLFNMPKPAGYQSILKTDRRRDNSESTDESYLNQKKQPRVYLTEDQINFFGTWDPAAQPSVPDDSLATDRYNRRRKSRHSIDSQSEDAQPRGAVKLPPLKLKQVSASVDEPPATKRFSQNLKHLRVDSISTDRPLPPSQLPGVKVDRMRLGLESKITGKLMPPKGDDRMPGSFDYYQDIHMQLEAFINFVPKCDIRHYTPPAIIAKYFAKQVDKYPLDMFKVYSGMLLDGKPHGQGVLTEGVTSIHGTFLNGKEHGRVSVRTKGKNDTEYIYLDGKNQNYKISNFKNLNLPSACLCADLGHNGVIVQVKEKYLPTEDRVWVLENGLEVHYFRQSKRILLYEIVNKEHKETWYTRATDSAAAEPDSDEEDSQTGRRPA